MLSSLILKYHIVQVWWCMPLVQALQRQRQEFKVNLVYIEKLCMKEINHNVPHKYIYAIY